MKKSKKIFTVVFALAAVCIVTTLAYFYGKGSAVSQNGVTVTGETAQGSVTQQNEQQENEIHQGVSSHYVINDKQGTTSKQESSANKTQENTVKQISFTQKNTDPLSKTVDFDSITAKYGDVIAAIEKGYRSLQSPIDLSDFDITYDELRDVIEYLCIGHGYYYVKGTYNYSTLGECVEEYNPEYFFTAKEIERFNKQIDDAANGVAQEAAKYKTDIEKLIFIHNYLIANITYGAENADIDNNLYGAFVLKNTLCTGYSEAFSLIASKVGIESGIVTSMKLAHAWNIVLLNGRYYYVDCAWDDPTITNRSLINNPVSGYGRYRYFMCSEEYLYKNDHTSKDWLVSGHSVSGLATSKFYDNFFWRDYETLMKSSSGSWYQNYGYEIQNAKIDQVKFSIDKITFSNNENYDINTARTIYTCWTMSGSYYPVFFSTLQSYNDSVYYIRADGIYKINNNGILDGSKDVCVFKNPRNDNIYDFCIDKSKKTFTVVYGKTMENNSSNAAQITYKISDYEF